MQKLRITCLTVLILVALSTEASGNTCSSSCSCAGLSSNGGLTKPVKQCTFKNLNDGRDNGLIKTCGFRKSRSDTALRVTYQGDLRLVGCPGGKCCRRWFITINGKECTAPAPIDAVIYADITINMHRPGTLDGLCQNIPDGHITVGISVGACAGSHPRGDAYTGWNSVSRLIIEEVPPLQ